MDPEPSCAMPAARRGAGVAACVLACAFASACAAKPPAHPSHPSPGRCLAPERFHAAAADAERENRAALDGALRRAGLERLNLPTEHRGEERVQPLPPGSPGSSRFAPPWQPFDEGGRSYVAGPTWTSDCCHDPAPTSPVFARDGEGRVYRVAVEAERRRRSIVVCGCAPQPMCRCGLPTVWLNQRRFALPPGTRFAKETKTVRAPVVIVAPRYAKTSPAECPMLPQPP